MKEEKGICKRERKKEKERKRKRERETTIRLKIHYFLIFKDRNIF